MSDDLETLVNQPSGSHDIGDIHKCAELLAEMGTERFTQAPEIRSVDSIPHMYWRFGQPRVLIACHYDTVWPAGTVERWSYSADSDKATGPGIFDMKAGIVESFYVLSEIDPEGVVLLLTGDEEIGSGTSRSLIEELAADCEAALILEPGHHGAIKTGRKGVSFYQMEITGKAAHAGLEPQNGVNALLELAHKTIEISKLNDPPSGNTVNPTVGRAGTTNNVIPATARLEVDVRAVSREKQEEIDKKIRALKPKIEGATFAVTGGGINRYPFSLKHSRTLYEKAKSIYSELSDGELEAITVGGGSDGNFTAGIGVPTLDGLGAVGDGAHAEGEWIYLSSMAERGALVGALIEELTATA